MFSLTLKSEWGELVMGKDLGTPFTVVEIEGLSSPEATINMSDLALVDGKRYNSAKTQVRTLNIAFAIEYDAARNRLEVYKVLRVKKPVRMIYESLVRNVYIDGYVQQVEISHFEMKQIVTLTMVCPQPYFKQNSIASSLLATNIQAFHFPFAITEEEPIPLGFYSASPSVTVDNAGEADTGLLIEIQFTGTVGSPTITDLYSSEYFTVTDTFYNGQTLTINTFRGEKTAYIEFNGMIYDELPNVADGSTWFQLSTPRTFVVSFASGDIDDVSVKFSYYPLFEGV